MTTLRSLATAQRLRLAAAGLALLALLLWDLTPSNSSMQQAKAAAGSTAVATFAGGCFWCMQPPYDGLDGVVKTTVGYTGGTKVEPSYEEVTDGTTGHAEAVEVVYEPAKVSYETLLDIFWHNIDPVTKNAQFCDHGTQYRTAIFYHDIEQKRLAEASKAKIETSGILKAPIVTQIVPAGVFYPAEDYHQEFYTKSSVQYKFYRYNCGRDARLRQVWGAAAATD
ncbi:peptide-methionine (S)-S-oxide reductase [Rhizobiales bacterium GAS113]|jgi:peptide-methionine (S)-S-oxide reductase|nr:peptide-methionine (S)-S-oxide reductase [Rhizobiales bacterium GAS113]